MLFELFLLESLKKAGLEWHHHLLALVVNAVGWLERTSWQGRIFYYLWVFLDSSQLPHKSQGGGRLVYAGLGLPGEVRRWIEESEPEWLEHLLLWHPGLPQKSSGALARGLGEPFVLLGPFLLLFEMRSAFSALYAGRRTLQVLVSHAC